MDELPIVTRLRKLRWQVNCEVRGLIDDTTAYEAADLISELIGALRKIAESAEKYTTGEGHQECRQIALSALAKATQ